MDKVQFIAAKDLPVAESKDVNALCVENGELKQKPMSGGAGGYVIRLKQEWMLDDSETFQTDICYDEIAELVYNGGSVWLDASAVFGVFMLAHCAVVSMVDEANYGVAAVLGNANITALLPAGTWQPPVE